MNDSTTSQDRRAQLAAWLGFLLQLVFFATLAVVGWVYKSDAIAAAARWMLGGVAIWPIIGIVYGQRRRTLNEKLEAEALKRTREASGTGGIFDTEDEAYLVERRRLRWMLRWLVPSAGVVVALYNLLGALFFWHWTWGTPLQDAAWRRASEPGQAMSFVGGAAFLCFLFSRYTAGMSRVRGWRLLRAGASYLAGNALACLLVLIAVALQDTDLANPEALVCYLIRAAMLLLGIELTANLVLDFYRPRTAGQESRPAFDSRLLAIITEPGGLARSLADAINYQFGFEVSGTWFYQLLKRALMPMFAFGLIALFALSVVLIVDADEQAVMERFGRRLQGEGQALGPGPHLKAPWPLDRAYVAPVRQVRLLTVGTRQATGNDDETPSELKPILWGEKHSFNAEMLLVTAARERSVGVAASQQQPTAADGEAKAIPVGLLMVSVDIQYRIGDLYRYLYAFTDPEAMLESLAYQVLTKFAAGVDVDRFLGAGRQDVNAMLHAALQEKVDALGLGFELIHVGLQEAHPTDEVAKSFQRVVEADLEKTARIVRADGEATELLVKTGGSVAAANRLNEAILARDELARQDDVAEPALAAAETAITERLLGVVEDVRVGGEAARQVSGALANAQRAVTDARGKTVAFSAELAGFRTAPELYRTRKYLEMLRRSVELIRKYIIVVRPETRVIIEYEKEDTGVIELGEEPA